MRRGNREKIGLRATFHVLLCSALLSAALGGNALSLDQPERLNFNHLSVADGLIQGTVHAIIQDQHGFIWFGTQQGLNRYDGVTFKTYLHDPQDPNSLPADWIWSLYVDPRGQLWVGTHRGGLARYDDAIDGFHRVASSSMDVRQIAADHDGTLWLAINGRGAARYTPSSEQIEIIELADPDTPVTRSVYTDAYDNVWLGTEKGLLRRDPLKKTFDQIPGIPLDTRINRLSGNGNDLWIATEKRGLYRVDITTFEVQQLTSSETAAQGTTLASNTIREVLADEQGNVWVGHDIWGINFVTADQHIQQISSQPGNRQSLIDDHIRALFTDRNGLLWVGTQNGVTYINATDNGFVNFTESPSPTHSLTSNWVSNFAEKSPSKFWVATYGGGVNLIDLQTQQVTTYRHDPEASSGLVEDRVMALEVNRDGELWAGTRSSGISVLEADGDWRTYQHDPERPDSLSHNVVSDLMTDRQGNLWITTMGGGINRFVPQTDSFVHYRTGASGAAPGTAMCSERILKVFQSADDVIWFASYDAGICRLNTVTGQLDQFSHDPDDVHSLSSNVAWLITEDKYGNMWFGTENAGINVWLASDRAENQVKFHRLSMAEGLYSNVVYGIVSDSLGRIWVGSNRGLTRYTVTTEGDRIELDARHYTVDDGLPGNEFNYAAALRASNGKLLFGGTAGLTVLQPETQNMSAPPPAVVLTDFRKLNEPVEFSTAAPAFTVEYDDKLVQFSYAALDYAAPRRIRYQHFLKGFDETWVDDGNLSQTTYTNLAPGEYEFNVRAIREGDAWPESSLRIPVVVNAPFWATPTAYASYVVVFAMFALLAYRSWARRLQVAAELQRMNITLRAEVKEREKQELALQQAQQQTRQFLNVAEVPIIALDAAGCVTMINQKGTRLLGTSEEQIIGQNFAASFVPQDGQQEFERTLAAVDEYSYSESRVISSGGTERLIAWHNVRLSPEDNPANGILMSGSDITQMRKLEAQLRDGQKMEALGTLARGVAHDFNNILSAILGYTELTRTQLARQPQATDYLDKLESSVNRAKEIVASVLAFGRAQQLPLEMINLSTVMDDALHLVRPIVPANVRLVEDIEPAEVPVLANPSQITQILLNLCTNACQAMAEDGGTLQVSLRNQNINRAQARESGKLQSGPHLRICVADTGKGMDEYTVARIFEPFFTTQPAGRGSGLGLSVVHGVVSQIGGTIEVSSTPESGSRFEIIVPCMSGEEMPDTDTGAVTSQAATGTETILFVDDEADLAHVAKLGLGQMGYSVITADNGAEALALLEQHIVHMIVTDQTMPVMRGEELAERVKQKYPDIPILLISGADQPEAETVDGFLTKPYPIAELAAKIRTMMATAPRSA